MPHQKRDNKYGNESLGGVEEECLPEISLAECAAEVGRANVAGTDLANIDAVGLSDDEGEGNRAEQIADDRAEEVHDELGHDELSQLCRHRSHGKFRGSRDKFQADSEEAFMNFENAAFQRFSVATAW